MSVLKKNVKLKEKIFHQFEREKERTITLSQKKNEEKINRLRQKNLNTTGKPSEKVIPDKLAKYKDIKIF